jgi:hypothetical protein
MMMTGNYYTADTENNERDDDTKAQIEKMSRILKILSSG